MSADLRPTRLTPGFLVHAEGSVLIEVGRTRVVCSASVEDRVPPFLRNTGKGWVTAEYGMLPRATSTRTQREASAGKVGGRTQEIQRLIGRSLRSVARLTELGERTIWVDCDVLQADGGTRTASITGGFVAMVLAMQRMREAGQIKAIPVQDYVAATSVGVVGGIPMLDLAYEEDSRADVDMNIVKTGDGRFIEVQGTAEGAPFERQALDDLMALGDKGIRELVALQQTIVGSILTGIGPGTAPRHEPAGRRHHQSRQGSRDHRYPCRQSNHGLPSSHSISFLGSSSPKKPVRRSPTTRD